MSRKVSFGIPLFEHDLSPLSVEFAPLHSVYLSKIILP